MSHRLMKAAGATLLLLAGSSLGACAGGARSAEMVASSTSIAPVTPGQPGYRAFRVGAVTGGGETNPMWVSNVSSTEFKSALEQSLAAAGHLADTPDQAAYEVTANMTALDRPMAGISMTVTSTVRYQTTPTVGGAPILNELVAASGTAQFGESLIGTERLRIANEASMRENIVAFIKRLRTALASAPQPIP